MHITLKYTCKKERTHKLNTNKNLHTLINDYNLSLKGKHRPIWLQLEISTKHLKKNSYWLSTRLFKIEDNGTFPTSFYEACYPLPKPDKNTKKKGNYHSVSTVVTKVLKQY